MERSPHIGSISSLLYHSLIKGSSTFFLFFHFTTIPQYFVAIICLQLSTDQWFVGPMFAKNAIAFITSRQIFPFLSEMCSNTKECHRKHSKYFNGITNCETNADWKYLFRIVVKEQPIRPSDRTTSRHMFAQFGRSFTQCEPIPLEPFFNAWTSGLTWIHLFRTRSQQLHETIVPLTKYRWHLFQTIKRLAFCEKCQS